MDMYYGIIGNEIEFMKGSEYCANLIFMSRRNVMIIMIMLFTDERERERSLKEQHDTNLKSQPQEDFEHYFDAVLSEIVRCVKKMKGVVHILRLALEGFYSLRVLGDSL